MRACGDGLTCVRLRPPDDRSGDRHRFPGHERLLWRTLGEQLAELPSWPVPAHLTPVLGTTIDRRIGS